MPSRRESTESPDKQAAWEHVRAADRQWAEAIRPPPGAGFAGRLARLSEAAAAERDAFRRGIEAGLAWRAVEFRPGAGIP